MYLDALFEVTEVDRSFVKLHRWPKRPSRICRLYDADDLDVEEGDKVHVRIENHSTERGWAVGEVYGFHYDDEKKDCTVCRSP